MDALKSDALDANSLNGWRLGLAAPNAPFS